MATMTQTHVALETRLTAEEAAILEAQLHKFGRMVARGVVIVAEQDREVLLSAMSKVATALHMRLPPFD
jgi:hypothetical protein